MGEKNHIACCLKFELIKTEFKMRILSHTSLVSRGHCMGQCGRNMPGRGGDVSGGHHCGAVASTVVD